jgi:hypothetical protein
MDLRKRNLAELTMAEELTRKISEKINNGMTLLGTLVGGVNDWTQVYYFYNSDKKAVLDSKDENGEMSYDVDCLILIEELLEFANHIAKFKKISSSNDKIYLSI